MTRIFISYSRVDKTTMKHIAELLKYGYDNVWYDTAQIAAGEDWWNRIVIEIEKCNHFIFLMSPESVNSEICMQELDKAIEFGKHIIPVRIRDRTPYPDKIKNLHTIDAFNEHLPDGISRIYGAIVRNMVYTPSNLTELQQEGIQYIVNFWLDVKPISTKLYYRFWHRWSLDDFYNEFLVFNQELLHCAEILKDPSKINGLTNNDAISDTMEEFTNSLSIILVDPYNPSPFGMLNLIKSADIMLLILSAITNETVKTDVITTIKSNLDSIIDKYHKEAYQDFRRTYKDITAILTR